MTGGLSKKKKIRKILYSRGMIVVLLILLFFMARATWGVYQKNVETREALQEAQVAYTELETRRSDLEQKLKLLNTEKGLEREIRDTYGVAKDGEGVIIIVKEEGSEREVTQNVSKESWWKTLFPF